VISKDILEIFAEAQALAPRQITDPLSTHLVGGYGGTPHVPRLCKTPSCYREKRRVSGARFCNHCHTTWTVAKIRPPQPLARRCGAILKNGTQCARTARRNSRACTAHGRG